MLSSQHCSGSARYREKPVSRVPSTNDDRRCPECRGLIRPEAIRCWVCYGSITPRGERPPDDDPIWERHASRDTKTCRFCCYDIQAAAIVCRYCRTGLTPEGEEAIAWDWDLRTGESVDLDRWSVPGLDDPTQRRAGKRLVVLTLLVVLASLLHLCMRQF